MTIVLEGTHPLTNISFLQQLIWSDTGHSSKAGQSMPSYFAFLDKNKKTIRKIA